MEPDELDFSTPPRRSWPRRGPDPRHPSMWARTIVPSDPFFDPVTAAEEILKEATDG